MISTFLFVLLSIFLQTISTLLGFIPVFFMSEFSSALAYFATYFKYARGLVNVPEIMPAIIFLVQFIGAWYGFKVIMWGWHMLPWVGKKDELHNFGKNSNQGKK